MPIFYEAVQDIVSEITYKPGYRLLVRYDTESIALTSRVYLQVECNRPDAITGEPGTGRGGKYYLSEHMVLSEVVRIAFKLFFAYEEHECREFFKWRDRAVFGPHISVEALFDAATQLEYRKQQ